MEMIHTCDVATRLTEGQYHDILSGYDATCADDRWETDHMAGDGFVRIALYRSREHGAVHCVIVVTLNPQQVLTGSYDPLALFNTSDYPALQRRFDSLITDFTGVRLPPLPEWKADRIDCAYDVEVGQEDCWTTPTMYIDLARMGSRPGMPLTDREDWLSYRDETNSVTVNYYHKGPELRSRGATFGEEVLSRADRILRFEVQCDKPKLKYISQRRDFHGRQFSHFMDERLLNEQIAYYAKRVVGIHDYLTLTQASRVLGSNRVRSDVATRLVEFLKAISAAGGVARARDIWRRGNSITVTATDRTRKQLRLTNPQFRQRMKRLRELSVNAVPVPNRWGRSRIINPLTEFWRMIG